MTDTNKCNLAEDVIYAQFHIMCAKAILTNKIETADILLKEAERLIARHNSKDDLTTDLDFPFKDDYKLDNVWLNPTNISEDM